MEIDRQKEEFDALKRVTEKAEILSVTLFECASSRSDDALAYKEIKIDLSTSSKLLEKDDDFFYAKVSFKFTGRPAEDETKVLVNIEASFVIKYLFPGASNISIKELESFCNINPLFNCWPYWREIIQSMTTRMDLPPFTLPLLKIKQRRKEKED
ncbi:MAG: hypothetical protein WHT06_16230 [Desulfobacterales bacterium]